jgi:Na+/H+ antiporter NhaA
MSADYLNSVKVGVLAGSILSAILGGIVISRSSKSFDTRAKLRAQTTA